MILFLGIIILLSLLFIPRTYQVESFKERKGTQYWELNTGSKIGFTKIVGSDLVQKNPILYLHGGPGGKVTDKIIAAFRPLSKLGHDLYFYDQIGSGHSKRLTAIKEYSVERHRRDLKEIISEIGSEKVILLGQSWGAMLAINYLQEHHETIEKIILTGPGPILPINRNVINETAPDSLSLIAPDYSNEQGNRKANNWRSQLISKWAHLFHSKLASDKEVDEFFTYLNQELSKSTDCKLKENKRMEGGGGYYSHIMTFNSIQNVIDKRNQLKELNTPILILRGQCDNQKWGFTNEYLDLFTNSKLEIIENVGHDLISDDKKRYFEFISEFLKE